MDSMRSASLTSHFSINSNFTHYSLPSATILEESMPDAGLAATLDVIDNPGTIATVAKLFACHRHLGGIESGCVSNRIFAGSG
jgi:hypothetical protein